MQSLRGHGLHDGAVPSRASRSGHHPPHHHPPGPGTGEGDGPGATPARDHAEGPRPYGSTSDWKSERKAGLTPLAADASRCVHGVVDCGLLGIIAAAARLERSGCRTGGPGAGCCRPRS
jgi:hypothetical protein